MLCHVYHVHTHTHTHKPVQHTPSKEHDKEHDACTPYVGLFTIIPLLVCNDLWCCIRWCTNLCEGGLHMRVYKWKTRGLYNTCCTTRVHIASTHTVSTYIHPPPSIHLALWHGVELLMLGIPEITNLQQWHTIAIQECVFKLDVTIDNIAAMAIIQCHHQLLKVPPCLCFAEASLGRHVMKHVATGCIL